MGPTTAFHEVWITSGYTVHAALNVKWMIEQLERITGESCV